MKADAPKKIGKYDVVDLIGRGGMGVVYKAVDRVLGRPVAIKVVNGAAEHSELERFYREAQFTASLRHPNIVVVYDLGDFAGRPYLVMEYLDGQSLDSMLPTKTITMLQKISYVRQICSGLEYAHSRQPSIIHRDIKPANIVVLADGTVKIVDFGMARLVHSRHTRAGQLIGTLNYMSPEQIKGADLDARSDIFSTGVVLYQLLTSKLPFSGGGIAQTLKQIVGSPTPPLSQFIQGYSPALDHIIARALAKERDERYSSANEFSFDLLEVEEHLKSSLFGEHISRAERLLRDGQLDRARQELLNVLQIDREHVRANQLMRQVVQAIARKQDAQKGAEDSNAQPQAVRDQGIAARARMEKLNDVLSRAERAYSAGDLERASRAVDEAFELDPDAARAKSLNVQIAYKVAKHEQERRVQELLTLARRHISERKFVDALDVVKKAENLNPAASGIRDLMALAASGHEQEQRRRAVKRSATEILSAFHGSDPSPACKVAEAGVQQFPNQGERSQLKGRAQRQVGHQAWVAQQIAGTRALLAAGRNRDALVMVDAACRRSPGEAELESLVAIVRAIIQREETERRRTEIKSKADDALKRKNYAEAVQLLEAAKSEMKSSDFDELLQLAREEKTRFEWQQKVGAAAAQAQRLIDSGEYARAAEFLDSAARELSSEDLRILAASARRQWEDYRQELDELIVQANHLLEEGRPADAVACLEVKAATYGREPGFQSRLEQARQQQKAAAITKAAMAIRASLSSGDWNEARLQLTAARHDLGDSAELRELEADIDKQEARAIREKMAAILREVEDQIRLIGAQALASLQSADDLSDKAPASLRKRHEELKVAVNALLEEVKREQMHYAGGGETGPS